MPASFIPQYSPAEFAVSHFGPEIEHDPTQHPAESGRFQSEKHNMIVRMLHSDAFVNGQMHFQDIANVTQVSVKLVRRIYREMMA